VPEEEEKSASVNGLTERLRNSNLIEEDEERQINQLLRSASVLQ
jgi:hypothetical protein